MRIVKWAFAAALLLGLSGPREPLRVVVVSSAKGDPEVVEQIEEGREEVERQLRKHEDVFGVTTDPEGADVTVELKAYWVLETMESREQRISSPYGGFHVRTESWVDRHHYLLAVVTLPGSVREMTGVEVKKNGGSVEGAARDLVKQLARAVEAP